MAGLAAAFGSGAMTNSIMDLALSDVILAAGTNTTEAHPVVAHRIQEAVNRGARLIVIDPRPTALARRAHLWLQARPGSNVALLGAIARVIIEEGLADLNFIAERTENFEDFRESLLRPLPGGFSLAEAERLSGVPAGLIREAAQLYGQTRRGSIVYAMGVTQHSRGTDGVLALANLALLTGNLGRPGCGVFPLRGQNNVQGACDSGTLPDFLPGYRPAPGHPGLTLVEMNQAAREGRLKGMWIMGENPALSDPDSAEARRGLENLEFLVVSDLFLTETAVLADVVLPAASFAEKDGTFTNTERRVQLIRQVVLPPGQARTDLEAVAGVMLRLGMSPPGGPAEVFGELAAEAPILAGISHRRLGSIDGAAGLQWPCPAPDHPGTPILHREEFTRGKGRFHPLTIWPSAGQPDNDFPLTLTTGRNLYQYHTRSLSRRSELSGTMGEPYLEISPELAAAHRLSQGQAVRLVSRRGSIVTPVRIIERMPPNVVFMPFHYAEAAANLLTGEALDPASKMPELKVTAVRLECIIGSD